MVKNDNIRIKRKKADFLLYGFSYLFLILGMGEAYLQSSKINNTF